MSACVNNVHASLVFSMDEVGQDEYIGTHSMKVIFPASYIKSSIKTPIRRKCKRSTLVYCIACDSTYIKSLIIIPRKTLDSMVKFQKQWLFKY